jgi:hypothetical protein
VTGERGEEILQAVDFTAGQSFGEEQVRGTLPPGLQKKMQPCPRELEMMLPPPPPNYAQVVIGGNLVLVNRANFQIADVFHFEIN